jgi:hypothetical protein
MSKSDDASGYHLRDRMELDAKKLETWTAQESTPFQALLSGSKWNRNHLKWLGVKHDVDDNFDICASVLDRKCKQAWIDTFSDSQSPTQLTR